MLTRGSEPKSHEYHEVLGTTKATPWNLIYQLMMQKIKIKVKQ